MYFVIISIVASLLIITNGQKLAPYHKENCPSKYSFKYDLQTTILDLVNNSNADLKTCLLKNINNHSIVLIDDYHSYENALLLQNKITEIPNVIIITKRVTVSLLSLPSVRKILKSSHRTLVYITITNDDKFKCIDGVLNSTDHLFLEAFMNKLWHIYKIMRVGVTFPFSCKDKMAIYRGKRKSNQRLYDRTIKLIDFTSDNFKAVRKSGRLLTEDYPLRANIFYRFPTSITNCESLSYYTKVNLNDTDGYCGLDALVMHDIVKHFKFNLHFTRDDNCFKYGYMTSNSTSGSLGCVVRKKLDISFNSRFMTKYSEDYVYFLHFVTTSSLCALVKRPEVIPIELYAVSAYQSELWFLIISLIIAIGILTWAVATIKRKITGEKRERFTFYIKDTFTSIMFGFSLKRSKKMYLLRGTCLCSALLFVNIYQSHINHVFTTLLRLKTIETLHELYKSDNILHITASMKEIMKQIHNPEDKMQGDFLNRAQLISDNYTLGFLLQHRNVALLGRKNDAIMDILSQYSDENKNPTIDLVNECFYTYYLSFITRSGFPFYEEMQRFMQRVGEAGLPIVYYKWTCDMLGVPHSLPKTRKEPRPFAKIKLKNQRLTFGILAMGHILSLIVFIIELVKGRHRRTRRN